MEKMSNRMQEALSAKNMSQSELCKLTGIGKSSISTYLSGEYEPKQRNIYKIALALNVSEAWLMGYDVPMARTSSFGINDCFISEANALFEESGIGKNAFSRLLEYHRLYSKLSDENKLKADAYLNGLLDAQQDIEDSE